ncbi:hypothetical protein, partial [Rhizobium tibeticum]|uniref:hypothetical protein n=1 Tax=Rhizobium tibeticum TaxID=501024 RepID=UPI003F672A26
TWIELIEPRWKQRGLYIERLEHCDDAPASGVLGRRVVAGAGIAFVPKWNHEHGKSAPADVRIIHFSHAKPNTTYCVHREKTTFLEYRSKTPWANAFLRTNMDRRLNRIAHSVKRKRVRVNRALRSSASVLNRH